MKRVLLFAGTQDGRELAEWLAQMPLLTSVSVATDYGLERLAALPERIKLQKGRLERSEMIDLIEKENYEILLDATHPYATVVSENIRQAALYTGRIYHRLLRQESSVRGNLYVRSLTEAVQALAKTNGNILLTSGSKDLASFSALADAAERIYARVLPTQASLRACEELGLPHSHIIAMQGPFSYEMNCAILRQYEIAIMLSKDGGEVGGFYEKILAAETVGVQTIVIGRPQEEGEDMATIKTRLQSYAEEKL